MLGPNSWERRLTGLLLAGLLSVGIWAQAAARGYEQGKADATRALTPYGVVVTKGDGTCAVFTEPGQTIAWGGGPAKTHVVFLIQPFQ